jgi:hypothetical protein
MEDYADDVRVWAEYHSVRGDNAALAPPFYRARTFDSAISLDREIPLRLDPFYYDNASPAVEQEHEKAELCIPPLTPGNTKGKTWASLKASTTDIPSIVESETSSNGSDSDLHFEDCYQGGADRLVGVCGPHAHQHTDRGPSCIGSRSGPAPAPCRASGVAERYHPVMPARRPSVRRGDEGDRSTNIIVIGHPGHLHGPAPDPYHNSTLHRIHKDTHGNEDCMPSRYNTRRNSRGFVGSPKIIEISPGAEIILRGADEVSLQLRKRKVA